MTTPSRMSIIPYAEATKKLLDKVESDLTSTNKKIYDAAIEKLGLLGTNRNQLELYRGATCLNGKEKEFIGGICRKIETLSKAFRDAGTPSAPGEGPDESEAAAGAAASGAGRGEGPPKTPISLVDPDLKKSLEDIKNASDFDPELRTWIHLYLGLNEQEQGPLMEAFYNSFHTFISSKKEGTEPATFVLPALALAIKEKDSNYSGKTHLEIDGVAYDYHSLANSIIASENDIHPDLVVDGTIEKTPVAFIQGILLAKSHLEASTPHAHGAGAGRVGGAAASASAAAAAAAAAAPSIPKNIHGLQRKGTSNCWAHAMLQFLIHTFGRDELERILPDSDIKKTLLEAMLQYQKAGAGQILPDNIGALIRGVFANAGVGGVEKDTSRQHDAAEAIMALFTFGREREDSPITIVHATQEGISGARTAKSDMKKPMVWQLAYSDIRRGAPCPLKVESRELTAFIVHQGGSITSGHYTAIVKVEKKWYHLDDSSVTELSEEKVKHYLTPSQLSRPTIVYYKQGIPPASA